MRLIRDFPEPRQERVVHYKSVFQLLVIVGEKAREPERNGQQTSTAEFKTIEINAAVDPKLFEMPAEKQPEKQ